MLAQAEELRVLDDWVPWVALFAMLVEEGTEALHILSDFSMYPSAKKDDCVGITVSPDLEEIKRDLKNIQFRGYWYFIFSDSADWVICSFYDDVAFLFSDSHFLDRFLNRFNDRGELRRRFEKYVSEEPNEKAAVQLKSLIDWDAL